MDDFERDLSRNMHMQGERKVKWADISFESEAHNIFDPFYSSQSESYYSDDDSDSNGSEDDDRCGSSDSISQNNHE